jgi:putative spermidine/putrescine transport system ATP-binding protein
MVGGEGIRGTVRAIGATSMTTTESAQPVRRGTSELRPVGRAGAAGQSIRLAGITHRFGGSLAVDDVSLDIVGGELVALLGPSGCGKTTLLRIIAGFIAQERGSVLIGGQAVDHLPPNRRKVGIVFQNYALFPHMTVAENVAYGLRARRAGKAEIAEAVETQLALVQLGALRDRFPKQLSGGQQQRVALARALAVEPRILLLDEPFGALDKNLRLDMQIEIKRLQRQLGITAVLVTHDQEEALSLADRIAVLNRGKVEQFGAPSEIYDRPASLFVNGFVGTANLLKGEIAAAGTDSTAVALEAGVTIAVPIASAAAPGAPIVLSVRPEAFRLHREPAGERIPGIVRMVLPLGPITVYEIEIGRVRIKVTEPRSAARGFAVGDPAHLELASAAGCALFQPD